MNARIQRWFMPWRWKRWSQAIAIVVALIVLPTSSRAIVGLQQQTVRDNLRREQAEREKVRADERRLRKSLREAAQMRPADALDAIPDAN